MNAERIEAVALCKSFGVPASARKDARDKRQLEQAVAMMDRVMGAGDWADACRSTKPAWYHTGQREYEASLAATCLVRCGV